MMDTRFTIKDAINIMVGYADPEDLKAEHPMTGVGIVLLCAATLGTTDAKTLIEFTGCSEEFISAITFNMQNNRLWVHGRYDHSGWLSSDGSIDDKEFWDHIAAACGELWFPDVDTRLSVDTCAIYWNLRRRDLP